MEERKPKEPPPASFAIIERAREHGCSIFTAVDLAADELGVDPEVLAGEHLFWLLGQYGELQEPAGNHH